MKLCAKRSLALIFYTVASFSSSALLGYRIDYDKSGVLPEVDVYLFTEPDGLERMLKHFGIEKTAINWILKAGTGGATIATLLAPVTGGVSVGVAAGLTAGVAIIREAHNLLLSPIQSIIRQKYAPAKHVIKRGQSKAWNYKDVAKELKMGDPEKARFNRKLYIVVTAPNAFIPLLQDSLYIGQGYRFTVKTTGKKDAAGNPEIIGKKIGSSTRPAQLSRQSIIGRAR